METVAPSQHLEKITIEEVPILNLLWFINS